MSTPRRILIISDQPHIRAVVAKVLQLAPGSYREAEGVPHAIPLLSAKHEPTLVLVDALDGAPGSQVGHDILPVARSATTSSRF